LLEKVKNIIHAYSPGKGFQGALDKLRSRAPVPIVWLFGKTQSGKTTIIRYLTGADEAPALAGGAFIANWDGLTVGDLFERIRVSMPADRPGKLNREQIADIVSYLLTVNRFPAGKTELERQTEVLKEIRFESAKPDQKK